MKPNLPSFGADSNDYLPPLSEGAEISFKILNAPEKYQSLYGEKIRIGVKVLGVNDKAEGIELMKEYTVSSSALCWQEYHSVWHNPNQSDEWQDMCYECNWQLNCIVVGDKTKYKLKALE